MGGYYTLPRIGKISVSQSLISVLLPPLKIYARIEQGSSLSVKGIAEPVRVSMIVELLENMAILWRGVNEYRDPCLFISGSEDEIVPPFMVRDSYGGIDAGDKSFVLIEGAAPGLFKKENEEEVFAVIDRWLSELVGKSGQVSDAPALFSSA